MMIDEPIRVLIADDDEEILRSYESLLATSKPGRSLQRLQSLKSELFDTAIAVNDDRAIETTTCQQGNEAVGLVREAARQGRRYDVIILDIRMPPGISGVEAATQIRAFDTSVPIIFISGYADVQQQAIYRRVPPPDRLRYFHKPVKFLKLTTTITEFANGKQSST